MNKKIGLAFVLLFLIIGLSSTLIIASGGNFKADIKNYGQCVANATYQKNICSIENNRGYFECFKEANNLAEKNRTLKKQETKICREKKKEISENCKNTFKELKEDCLTNFTLAKTASKKINSSDCPEKCALPSPPYCPDGKLISHGKDKCGCRLPSTCENSDCKNLYWFDCNKTKRNCNDLRENIQDELKNIQKCDDNSDCVINGLNLPCSISLCSVAYNKNSDLNKILNLSKEYTDNCKEICLMMACMINKNSIAVCENHKCRIKEMKENYCKSSDNDMRVHALDRKSEMCADNYEPVCGWYNNSIQCFKYPCAQTFSNSCVACLNKNVLFWTDGKCPNAIL